MLERNEIRKTFERDTLDSRLSWLRGTRRTRASALASVIVAGGVVLVGVALADLRPVAHMWVNLAVSAPVTVAAYMTIKYRNRCGRAALMIALATLLVAFNPRMMVSVGAHAFDIIAGPVLVALGLTVLFAERGRKRVLPDRHRRLASSEGPTLWVIDGGTRDPFPGHGGPRSSRTMPRAASH